MVNWDKISSDLRTVLGYNALSVKEDGSQAFVLSENSPIAVLIVNDKNNDAVNLHLRASILPNTAALLSSVISHSHPVNISSNFEYNSFGATLYGTEALRYAAENAKVLREGADKSGDGNDAFPSIDFKTLN